MKRRMIAMTILVTMATSNIPVIDANADIRDINTAGIEVEVNQEEAEEIEEDKSNLTEENADNVENEDTIIEEDTNLNEEDIIYNNSTNLENESEVVEPNNIGILGESQIEVSNEIDTTVKSNDEITDETKILENQQLVDELEEQTWLLEFVATEKRKDISEVTLKDLKSIIYIDVDTEKLLENSIIPNIIGRFESLKNLKARGCIYTNGASDGNLTKVSKEIAKCINLKSVDISFNKLTEIPNELFDIQGITELILNCTNLKKIEGFEFDKIANLINLENIELSSDFINIEDIKVLKNLKKLESINIGNNNLCVDVESIYENISVSKKLDISRNNIYGDGKYLLNYNSDVEINCRNNYIYFSDEDIVKFEQYNERENDSSKYARREFSFNFFNNEALKGEYGTEPIGNKLSNIVQDLKVKKGTTINEVYATYKDGIRVIMRNFIKDEIIFKNTIPYKINIKNPELFDENGIAIKNGTAKIEIKYDDESVLWEDEFEVVPNITSLTIEYVDKHGNKIADQDVIEGDYGTSYTINPKFILGYRVEKISDTDLVDNYEYKFGNNNGVVKVVYDVFNELPVITGNDYIEIEIGDEFDPIKDLNISASDYEDGDISDSVEIIESNVDTTKVGEYEIILSAKDSEGQVSYFTATVKVKAKDEEKPVEPTEPAEPSEPSRPVEPSGNSDKNQNVNTTNKPTNNKNELPKTGGVSSSILLAIGALLVGAGKKKLQ